MKKLALALLAALVLLLAVVLVRAARFGVAQGPVPAAAAYTAPAGAARIRSGERGGIGPVRHHGLKPAAGTAISPVLARRRLRQTGLHPPGRSAHM
jgi:FlaG/FlaF family flagellin (archaellin)